MLALAKKAIVTWKVPEEVEEPEEKDSLENYANNTLKSLYAVLKDGIIPNAIA